MLSLKRSLALAVILCSLLPLCHASCSIKQAEPGMRQCLYDKDGTWHDIGSSWRTSDCMRCFCQANGDMGCCQTYFEPLGFPDDCMKEFDQKACKYNVFKKNDRSIPCHFRGSKGK
ncbi:beta-microseminoprotein E1-like [Coregonus clupeaformis]|uniref:beta-microseminoprotein E1-like n=1 Tax=Coregonus clupeaformis TaxID=59861 RepID=UPI001E1C6626|nr:beta-microseminoprotein E1-like [Coregonus clupeaformis]